MVHGPTRTCYNRHGELLSPDVENEFAAALAEIQAESHRMAIDWFDCEGLSRRHDIGKGSLIVLDALIDGPCQVRGYMIRGMFCPLLGGVQGKVHSIPQYHDGATTWSHLRAENKLMFGGVEFYEGIVAKRADSPYPMQLRNPDEEYPLWVKHRWAF